MLAHREGLGHVFLRAPSYRLCLPMSLVYLRGTAVAPSSHMLTAYEVLDGQVAFQVFQAG